MEDINETELNDTLIGMNIQQKYRDHYNAAKQRAIDKLVERYYTRAFQLQLQRGVCENPYLNEAYNFYKVEQDIEDKRLEKLTEEKGYKDKTDYMFITINPKDDIPFDKLKQTTEKIIEKTSWINQSEYAYSFEQRSNNPAEYSGYHVHMLVKTDDKPLNEIRRELKNKVKNIVDMDVVKSFDKGKNTKGPLSILPTAIPDNRIKYLLDWKKDKDKHAKQIVDEDFRQRYNLDRIYYQGELFSSLIIEQQCQQLPNIKSTDVKHVTCDQNMPSVKSHIVQ